MRAGAACIVGGRWASAGEGGEQGVHGDAEGVSKKERSAVRKLRWSHPRSGGEGMLGVGVEVFEQIGDFERSQIDPGQSRGKQGYPGGSFQFGSAAHDAFSRDADQHAGLQTTTDGVTEGASGVGVVPGEEHHRQVGRLPAQTGDALLSHVGCGLHGVSLGRQPARHFQHADGCRVWHCVNYRSSRETEGRD